MKTMVAVMIDTEGRIFLTGMFVGAVMGICTAAILIAMVKG